MQPEFEIRPADVDQALRHYLAQFAHVNCGGYPIVNGNVMKCSACKFKQEWLLPIGEEIKGSVHFRRLTI